ncbi:hypothetical protein Dimus_035059 [Dionaea muscipula]
MIRKVYPDEGSTVDSGASTSSSPADASGDIVGVLSGSPEKVGGSGCSSDGDVVVLTVWKKSLLFSCNGFTVFDGRGNLVFRVDNYVSGNKSEIVLMDADGKPLLTIRRKRLSLGEIWLMYEGETSSKNPIFSVRRHVTFLNSKTLAHVTSGNNSGSGGETSPSSSPRRKNNVLFEIQGSYAQRSVSVYDNQRRCVVEIRRKEAAAAGGIVLGVDVFRMIVRRSYVDTSFAMGLVIVLDQMFESSRRLSP